ncbi:hypothetical protein F5876DRAFT_85304 [Lentinula aff. lateritia]|uniref:Uncharacterized protein n=1 Tax=Lentinula aff. lateritia TaxID=2804960 RepID=A0ACC1TFW8_9AGAR|nr:hypothetical protein F5876DRAFT_85304 [Lentinula aff. lateritia]
MLEASKASPNRSGPLHRFILVAACTHIGTTGLALLQTTPSQQEGFGYEIESERISILSMSTVKKIHSQKGRSLTI